MNAPGEIAPLSRMARPHAAIVTHVGAAHLAAFDSVEAIAREKASIFVGSNPAARRSERRPADDAGPVATPARHAAPRGRLRRGRGRGRGGWSRHLGRTTSRHRRPDLRRAAPLQDPRHARAPLRDERAAVLAVAPPLGADPGGRRARPRRLGAAAGRGVRETEVMDRSMTAALRPDRRRLQRQPRPRWPPRSRCWRRRGTASAASGGRRIAILGDMLELGPDEARLHAEVAAACPDGRHRDRALRRDPGCATCGRRCPTARRGRMARDGGRALREPAPRRRGRRRARQGVEGQQA
jgi:UDP-N-acetylmuramoyl-tripeptide--D-alanyl-D-alanine ligase